VWQRLPAVTPTTGDIQPTAHLNGFTATLTTSQNPQFTRPVQLLAVDEHHRLPILDSGPADPDPAPPAAAPTSAGQSRSWVPRLPGVQRAHVGTPVQRISAEDEPAAVALPVIDTGGEPDAPRAMVQAGDLDERRTLDAVAAEDVPDRQPSRTETLTPAPTAVEHPAPPVPAVQRLTAEPVVLPAVVQRVSSSSSPDPTPTVTTAETFCAPRVRVPDVHPDSPTEIVAPTLRRLHTVQRIDSAAPALPVVAAALPELPAYTEPAAPTPELATAVQRQADTGDPIPVAVDDTDPPAPAVVLPAVDTPQVETPHADPPMAAATAAAAAPSIAPAPTPHAPAAVQRLTPQPNPVNPAPPPACTDDHPAATPETTTQTVDTTDLPVVSTELQTVALDTAPVTEYHEAPTVQRSPAVVFAEPETRREPAPHVHPVSVAAESRTELPTVMRSADGSPHVGRDVAPDLIPPVAATARSPIRLDHTARSAEPAVAQRVSLPVVDTTPPPPVAPQSARHVPPAPPVVQRSTGPTRRLVVLPPIGSAGDHDSSPGAAPSLDSAEVFSSPRPVGLQRMFEAGAHRGTQPLPAPAANSMTSSAPAQEVRSLTDTPQFTTSGHDYDATTNTITFASPSMPSIQRATEEPAPVTDTAAPVAAAPAPTSAPTASGSGTPGAAGTDVDELVNRVYDALAARLRAELWLDRERAGTLMDLGR
jgi:hypothetical protein